MMEDAAHDRNSLLRWGLTILVFALDCASAPDTVFPIFYIVILFIGRPPRVYDIWLFTLASVAFTMISPMVSVPPVSDCPDRIFWLNRLFVLVALVIASLIRQRRADY